MTFDIQRAGIAKRISAFLLDIILLSIVAVGMAAVLSPALGYDTYADGYSAKIEEYGKKYNIDFYITEEAFGKLSAAEQETYKASYQKAFEALSKDQQAVRAFSMMVNLTLVISSVSLLIAFLILEFAVPLFLKNGQTLGKKVFGIALIRTDGIRVTPFMMFVRTVLGKYTIETMIPVLLLIMIFFGVIGIVGTIVIGLILLLQVILFFATRNHSLIHDVLACTVPVDYSSQMIFDTTDELVAYKARLQAEDAARQDY